MTHLTLPRFQYTAREPVSGVCFTGNADELSKSDATFLAEYISVHLAGHGVDLSALTWQTDNGCEFLENKDEQGLPSTVRALGSSHRYILLKRYTWQSDVGTVHRLVEDEFFDRETSTGPAEFWAKATTYWYYFNLVRLHRGKERQSPLKIPQTRAPALAGAVCSCRPLNLAKRHHLYLPKPNHRGHDVLSFPKEHSRTPVITRELIQKDDTEQEGLGSKKDSLPYAKPTASTVRMELSNQLDRNKQLQRLCERHGRRGKGDTLWQTPRVKHFNPLLASQK